MIRRGARWCLTALLVACCAVVVWAWRRSYVLEDRVFAADGRRCTQLVSREGRIVVLRVEDFPLLRPRTWEAEPLEPPVRVAVTGSPSGVGGTLTFFLAPLRERHAGPVTIATGLASWTPDWDVMRARYRELARATTRPKPPPSAATRVARVSDADAERVRRELAGIAVPDVASWASPAAGGRSNAEPGFQPLTLADDFTITPQPKKPAAAPAVSSPAWGRAAAGGGTFRLGAIMPGGNYRAWPRSAYDSLEAPYWALLALLITLLALLNARAVRRIYVRRRRAARGLCLACGYDLRATSSACPECGAAAVTSA